MKIHTPFGMSEIRIEKGLFRNMPKDIGGLSSGKIFIISDSNVFPLYGEELKKNLEQTHSTRAFVFPAGEKSKSLTVYGKILEAMAAFRMERSDLVVALGGGVAGDLGGFAAATFKRGLPFVMIPTSLLAQVDASVGGKTAINLDAGKNLVGAFYAASKVLIDPELLRTLPERESASGMAEIIKCAAIRDGDLFGRLQRSSAKEIRSDMENVIRRAIEIKGDIVSRDPFDKGERMLLNFGHTYGHAVEKTAGNLLHGEAVAIGMMYVIEKSEEMGYSEKGTAQSLRDVLEKFHLPTSYQQAA